MKSFDEIQKIVKQHNDALLKHNISFTGHISATEYKSRIWSAYANDKNIKNILEVGFNAGHSAILLLESNLQAKLYSFEKYPIQKAITSIKNRYGHRFEIILGDSKNTLIEFQKRLVEADMVVIDGDHREFAPYYDLINLYQISKPGAVVIMDDLSCTNQNYIRAVQEGYVYKGIEIKGVRPSGLNAYEICDGIKHPTMHSEIIHNREVKDVEQINYSVGYCIVTHFVPKMKIGLMDYTTKNIGDWIQSVATLQFLPRIDYLYQRDKGILNRNLLKKNERSLLIFNAWTNEFIDFSKLKEVDEKLILSVHIADYIQRNGKLLGVEKQVSDLRDLGQKIGARDTYTENKLNESGISTFFSGCMTLTLKSKYNGIRNNIVLCDIQKYKEIRKMIPDNLLKNAKETHHDFQEPNSYDFKSKMNMAIQYLQMYESAKLVVTTRLHCALPCIAFGTPVIFIIKKDDPRIQGMSHLFEHLYDPTEISELKHIDWNNIKTTNRSKIDFFTTRLQDNVKTFLIKNKIIYEESYYNEISHKFNF